MNLKNNPRVFSTIPFNTIESGALDQIKAVLEHPSIMKIVILPDVHKGYTLPVGTVALSKDMIFPSFVGMDIGCGMCSVPTTFSKKRMAKRGQEVYDEILKQIPVGFNHRQKGKNWTVMDDETLPFSSDLRDIYEERGGAKQLGTLGGGNHFIEIGLGEDDDRIWITIHSGSRGFGYKVAEHYMKMASPNGKASDGNYGFNTLVDHRSDLYWDDMNLCLAFALENRLTMMEYVKDAIRKCGIDGSVLMDELVNRNHNHATIAPNGEGYIHRKGATHAEEGMMGVIPGNMRDGCFIVRGLGNPDALWSSSHGAGRVLGRMKAKKTLDSKKFKDTMKGIICNASKGTLDESPMAYKDIFEVMDLQSELVEIVEYVKPILVVKG